MTTQSSERESLSHLPGYVNERNARASAAALVIDKQSRKDGSLSTWYCGSEPQFRASQLLRIPEAFAFPARLGGRKLFALAVFCPASPAAELKCTIAKTGEDRYRLAVANEVMPVSWRALGRSIEVYKYTELREGPNAGPATVYVGPFGSLASAGIAPAEAARERQAETGNQHVPLWQSQPLPGGRYRFVVYHEAEARARAQDEERGRSNFKNPEQYQDWLLEVVAASIGMIRRQLRVKTKRRYVYTVPERTLKELEAHFAKLRRTIVKSEILVEKEDVRAEAERAELRRAALAAMRDAQFQRFLGQAIVSRPSSRKRYTRARHADCCLFFKAARFSRIGIHVYTRHPRFTPATGHVNGHDRVAPAPEAGASDAIVRAALTKEELQNLLFAHIGLSKRECREMVNAIFEEMRVALEAGEPVKLEGFGRFQPKARPKRWARNLKSGEKISISERRVVTFHPSKKLTKSIGSRPSAKPAARARNS